MRAAKRGRGPAGFLCALLLCGGAAAQDRFRKSPPLPDPLPELRLPQIESAVLERPTVAVVRKPSSDDQPRSWSSPAS
jgi:hypothetical protein